MEFCEGRLGKISRTVINLEAEFDRGWTRAKHTKSAKEREETYGQTAEALQRP